MRPWLALGVVGCSVAADAPSPRAQHMGLAGANSPAPAPASASASAPGEDPLPALPEAAAGDVYFGLRGQGVGRLDGDRVVLVFPTKSPIAELEAGPGGTLFASLGDAGTYQFVGDGSSPKKIANQSYQRLAFRSDTQIWGTPDLFSWAVHRFDGSRWTAGQGREAFKGTFDDNKLNDLAVTQDAVWVSNWNGLWKSSGGPRDTWSLAALPAGEKPPYNLATRGDHIIGRFSNGWYEWDQDNWLLLSWPVDALINDVSPSGTAVGIDTRTFRSVVLGKLGGNETIVTSEPLPSKIDDVEIDSRGRAWVTGDLGLTVVHPNGKIMQRYLPGALQGANGRLEQVAVVAGGPPSLPVPSRPRVLTVRGKVQLYKSGKPLPNVVVEICAGYAACADGVWKRATTTADDGTFTLTEVLPGDLVIHVQPLDGLEDCKTPFTAGGVLGFSVREHCTAADGTCDVGTVGACLPFELPPR